MIVTNKITFPLDRRVDLPVMEAVQGDSARAVEFSLQAEGTEWSVPEGATAIIHYRRFADGTGGAYDTMGDGTPAYSISGSTVTVYLAPQIFSAAGIVELQVTLLQNGAELTFFSVPIRVQGNLASATMAEEDYETLSSHIRSEVNEAVMERLTALYVSVTQPDGALTSDKTYAEIFAAYEAGQAVYCQLPDGSVLTLAAIDDTGAVFQGAVKLTYQRVVITSDDTITYNSGQYGGESGDYIPTPETAEVGQIIVVKAVDENGKPTEWEAVDMASEDWALVGAYVHSGNHVVQPDSVDISTGVWTVNAGHGLSTGDVVCMYTNSELSGMGAITGNTCKKIPGALGIDPQYGYTVTVIDETTFTLGSGSTGTTALDLSGATEVDCSLFRFECKPWNTLLCKFVELQDYKAIKILMRGQAWCQNLRMRFLGEGFSGYHRLFAEETNKTTAPYLASASITNNVSPINTGASEYITVLTGGSVTAEAEIAIDKIGDRCKIHTAGSSTNVTYTTLATQYNGAVISNTNRSEITGVVTGIEFNMYYKTFVANGFTVEVYAK